MEKKTGEYVKKYIRILLNIAIMALCLILIFTVGLKLIKFFMPFVIGWVIALIANPLVRLLEKKLKIVRKHSSMVIVIVVLFGIVLFGYMLISRSLIEITGFVRDLPKMYQSIAQSFQEGIKKYEYLFQFLPYNAQVLLDDIGLSFSTYMTDLMSKADLLTKTGTYTMETAGNLVKSIPNILIQVIVTILSSYFFIADRDKIMESLRKAMPDSAEHAMDMIFGQFKSLIGGYFKAQFKIMFVVMLILFVGFLILQVPYAILLAFLIAFLDFLPFFGTGTALLPWAIVQLISGNYSFAVGLIIIYLVSQFVRQVIQPKIVGDSMGLDPLSTLLFMYIGFKLKGIAGMILAVPIGLIFLKLYEWGAFSPITDGIKEIISDINSFRKGTQEKEKDKK